MAIHVPVMPQEMLAAVEPRPGQIIADCTVGAGGHCRLLAERVGSTGRVIALDQDQAMIALAKTALSDLPVTLVQASFEELQQVLQQQRVDRVDAVLADLGVCSDQLSDPARGFSFHSEGPLDMRLDATRGVPAAHLLATLPEREIADLIWRYGEERHSRRIAKRIVNLRKNSPIETTGQLADLVRGCVPRGRERIDPATRTFQALRIAVNDELGALESLLKQLPQCMKPGGRVAIISFHSLEDRLVKQAFRQRNVWQPLTKKPMTPSEVEMKTNPRSRSAKMRVAIRMDAGGEA